LHKVGIVEWKNESIEITECNYSKDRGFERIRAEKIRKKLMIIIFKQS